MSPEEIARAEKALAENDRQADENARFLKLKPEIMALLLGYADLCYQEAMPGTAEAVLSVVAQVEGKE